MDREPRIRFGEADFGSHPEAFPLNASFQKDLPILKLRVDVDWEPKAPAAALALLEAGLLEVCPGLRRHQCRGDASYHVLRPPDGKPGRGGAAIEAPLALAHLLEHVVIDAIAFITDEPLISGATAALSRSFHEFDLFVESPDPLIARLTAELARSWITEIARGAGLDGAHRLALDLCRRLYRAHPGPVEIDVAARPAGRDAGELRQALDWIERHGLVRRVRYGVNLSGRAYYELIPAAG